MRFVRRTLLGLLMGCAASMTIAQQAGDVKSLLEQGLYSYEEGDFDAAVEAFEKAFALNPSSDAIQGFLEKATLSKVMSMVRSKDPKMAGIGREILRSSTRVRNARISDPQAVRAAVDEVLGAEGQEQLILMIRHSATFGRNLVPALIPVLSDSSLARRTTAMTWIPRIGIDAVPVLQAARKHPDATVRANVAYLLGHRLVRHTVSLATLKAMMETDPESDAKAAATKSYALILSELNGQGKQLTAKEHFLENAYHQFYKDPYKNPFASTYYAPTIYKLAGDQVVGERVAEFQLSERMAMQALEEALDLDPEFLEARVLTVCNDAAQVVEYDQNAAYYSKNESQVDTKELLEKQKRYMDEVLRLRVLSAPARILYEGLLQAIDDGRSDVSRKLIETIHETEREGKVPESLVKALEDPNSRLVRVAAATAIAYWNPLSDFNAGDLVISNLSEAVVTSGVRTVQKIMGAGQQANRVDDILRELNMESYTPIDSIERAYDAVVSSPPDLVIMDESVRVSSGRKDLAPINHFVNELRKNYRSANVPVVVMVPSTKVEEAKRLYENEERKVYVISDSADRQALEKGVLEKLFRDKTDAKALATRLARQSAEALEHLGSVPTRLPVKESIPSLLLVLKNRPDEVRLPCIRALGELNASEAAGELAAVYANPQNTKEIRVAAMRSVGKVLEGSGRPAPAPVLKTIEEGMKESDLDLRRVSWYAFSNAEADGRAQLEALLAQPAGLAAPPAAAEPPSAPEADTPAAGSAPPKAAGEEEEGDAGTAVETVPEDAADVPAAEAEPAAEEPAVEEPAAEEPAAEEPAAEEPEKP